MEFVRIEHPLFPDGVEVNKELLKPENKEELNRELIALGSQLLPDEGGAGYGYDVIRGISSSARQLMDFFGVEGKPENDADIEMFQRMRDEGDTGAWTARLAGELLDPVTAPAAILKFLKGKTIITELMKRGAAAGTFSGAVQPVYEEYGDSRLFNTAAGAVLGSGVGAALGSIARKLGFKSADEMAARLKEMDAAERAELEAKIAEEVKALEGFGARNKERQAEASARLDEQKVLQDAARTEARAKTIDEYKADLKAKIARGEEEVDYRMLEKNIKSMENQIKFMDGQSRLAKVEAKIKSIKGSKLTENNKKKALEPLYEERKYQTAIRDEAQKQLDSLKERYTARRTGNEAKVELQKIEQGEYSPVLRNNIKNAEDQAASEVPLPEKRPKAKPAEEPVQTQQTAEPTPAAPQQPVAPVQQAVNATPQAPVQTATQAPAVPQMQAPTNVPDAEAGAVKQFTDNLLGSISARIEKFAPEIMHALRKFEAKVMEKQANYINPSKAFFDEVGQLSPDQRRVLKGHLYNGRFKEAEAMMNPIMRKEFRAIRSNIDQVYKELKAAGIDVNQIADYFPRRVKDIKGLRQKLGREHPDVFKKALKEAVDRNKGKALTDEEMEEVLNKVVRTVYRSKDPTKRGSLAARTLGRVDDELLDFYHDPSESLTMYYRNMVDMTEKAKFFGRDRVVSADNKIDNVESIGNVIKDTLLRRNLNDQQIKDLTEMLTARFVEGEQAPTAVLRWTRDTGYMGTIGNFVSAITNLGDLGTSGALHGFTNTIAAVFGKNKYDIIKMGIDHSISHELMDNRATAKFLQGVFKWSGFRDTDRLGKNALINAAMRKNEKLAQSDAGKAALRKRWSKYFGDETESLINDLDQGNITENTKLLAFHELSNVQPISLSEMPLSYLRNPNGRIFYMMKSFTLKQLDLVRRHIIREAKQGNTFVAAKNMVMLSGYLAAANTSTQVVKDWILGRDIDPAQLPDQAMWNVLSVLGVNKYIADRYLSQGDIKGAFLNTVVPPTPVYDLLVTKTPKEVAKIVEGEEYNLAKLTKELPIVGSWIYSWFGGGKENYNDRLAKAGEE